MKKISLIEETQEFIYLTKEKDSYGFIKITKDKINLEIKEVYLGAKWDWGRCKKHTDVKCVLKTFKNTFILDCGEKIVFYTGEHTNDKKTKDQ